MPSTRTGLAGCWEALLGATTLAGTTTSSRPGCRWRTASPGPVRLPSRRQGLHLRTSAAGSGRRGDRALDLSTSPLDIGQGRVPWVVLGDPEGKFVLRHERPGPSTPTASPGGPTLDSGDPRRDAAFWAELSGWAPRDAGPCGRPAPPLRAGRAARAVGAPERGGKNRLRLRHPARGEDPEEVVARVLALGGREVDHGWGELQWRVVADPSRSMPPPVAVLIGPTVSRPRAGAAGRTRSEAAVTTHSDAPALHAP